MSSVDDVVESMREATIQDAGRIYPPQSTLAEAVRNVNEALASLQRYGSKLGEIINLHLTTPENRYGGDGVELCILRRQVNETQALMRQISHSTSRLIARHIISLGSLCGNPVVQLVSSLLEAIEQIVREKMDQDGHKPEDLWRIVESCYFEAVHPRGRLSLHNKAHESAKANWTNFWVRALNNSPGGSEIAEVQ